MMNNTLKESPSQEWTSRHLNAQNDVELQELTIASATQELDHEDELLDGGWKHEGVSGQTQPKQLSRPLNTGRQRSCIEEDEASFPVSSGKKDESISWSDLPNKKQLAILTLARLSEPLSQTSLQAYMFYQLKSFDSSLPDSTISSQAGVLQASFTAAQCLTAIGWGGIADSDWGGRKRVLLVGTLGTCISSVGVGFSRTFVQATLFRVLGGAMNGNPGVSRTMVSEIIQEKKSGHQSNATRRANETLRFQSRAFLLLPMCANIGIIIGPILGGLLANPVESYPRLLGDKSILGGKDGVWWMKHWPYALPNLVNAMFLLCASMGIFFGLEESPGVTNLTLGCALVNPSSAYFNEPSTSNAIDMLVFPPSKLPNPPSTPTTSFPTSKHPPTPIHPLPPSQQPKVKFSIRRLWTRNVICTLLAFGLLAFHISTFQNLWFIFLSTPRFNPFRPVPPTHLAQSLPIHIAGGLGMPPSSVGFAMAILGVIGITLQLLLYPPPSTALGTLRSFRASLLLFPITYTLAPYLALVPSSLPPPHQVSGILVYVALAGILFIQVLARTFALPAAIILINNSSPHPSVLGTLHGVAQSVTSAMRTAGPVLGGWGFGEGLRAGVVGGVWWVLAAVAMGGWAASGLVFEGNRQGEGDEGEEGTEGRV